MSEDNEKREAEESILAELAPSLEPPANLGLPEQTLRDISDALFSKLENNGFRFPSYIEIDKCNKISEGERPRFHIGYQLVCDGLPLGQQECIAVINASRDYQLVCIMDEE